MDEAANRCPICGGDAERGAVFGRVGHLRWLSDSRGRYPLGGYVQRERPTT